MNQQEIMRLLPHRDNMLLVDQAEVCPQEEKKSSDPPAAKATPSPEKNGF